MRIRALSVSDTNTNMRPGMYIFCIFFLLVNSLCSCAVDNVELSMKCNELRFVVMVTCGIYISKKSVYQLTLINPKTIFIKTQTPT